MALTIADNPPQPPKLELMTPPEGVFSVYSNHAGINASMHDIRLMFGELGNATPEKVQVFQRVHVLMSWIQAKAIARLLQDYVDTYEKLNGPLMPPTLPPQVPLTNPFPGK